MVAKKLSQFSDMFDLDEQKREIILYTFYTMENIESPRNVHMTDMEVHLMPPYKATDERPYFRDICRDECQRGCPDFYCDGEWIDHVDYYLVYHRNDALVLAKGLQEFRRRIMEIT